MATPVPKGKAKSGAPPPSVLAVSQIEHGDNPRFVVDADRHLELTESVKQHGILQPIRVRELGPERYQIIAGHRRFEAARSAGLETVPVILATTTDDNDVFVESLVENIQREDLDPIDEAKAFRAILDRTKMTQGELGKRVGKTQSMISQSVALLGLAPSVQEDLSAGRLTMGHAKVIAYMPADKQAETAKAVVEQKMTVRTLEDFASRRKQDDDRERKREEQVKAEAVVAVDLLKAKKIAKDRLIVFYNDEVAAAVVEAGWKNARKTIFKTDTTYPQYQCDCQAIYFSPATGGQTADLRMICVDKGHEKASTDAIKAKERKEAKEAETLVDRSQRNIARALKASDAVTPTDEGLRLLLYVTLMREEMYGGDYQRSRETFVKAHGGEWYVGGQAPKDQGGIVWRTIAALKPDAVLDELIELSVRTVFVNVFAARYYANEKHAAARQWFVDNLVLPGQQRIDPVLVWGNDPPKEAQVIETEPVPELEPALCDICGGPQEAGGPFVSAADAPADWNPETGNHLSCEDDPELASGFAADKELDEPSEEEPVPETETMEQALASAGLASAVPTEPAPVTIEGATPYVAPDAEEAPASLPFNGQVIVVTGVVDGLSRDEVAATIARAGGQAADVVTKNTTLLVVGDRPGATKVKKAADLGVPSITEKEFRSRLG